MSAAKVWYFMVLSTFPTGSHPIPPLQSRLLPGDALGSFPCDGQVHLAAHHPTERALFASQADLQCATRAAVNREELGDR